MELRQSDVDLEQASGKCFAELRCERARRLGSLDENTYEPPTTVQARRRPSQCPKRQKDLQRRGKHGGASMQAMWSWGL